MSHEERLSLIKQTIAASSTNDRRAALCDMADGEIDLLCESFLAGEAITVFDLVGDALRRHFGARGRV